MHTTYRVLGGVSMGAIGASALGFEHHAQFDGLALLGGPLDAAFFSHMLEQSILGGFCPREVLEELSRSAPASLNDRAVIDACAPTRSVERFEHAQRFNAWKASVGTSHFDRSNYLTLVHDLLLAYGNLFFENPDSPFAPPGVPAARLRRPPADFCVNPVRVPRLYNAEYNPQGTHDAITFCDGQQALYFCRSDKLPVDFCSEPANIERPLPQGEWKAFAERACQTRGGAKLASETDDALFTLQNAGRVDPCRQQYVPATVMLAYDYNRNGRRDYGEPVIDNGYERFEDVGVDGCGDSYEDGQGGCRSESISTDQDPNGDNYALSNISGTEGNWRRDEAEPYRDFGLDGVEGTGDFGEGNGTYDVASGRRRLWELDGRSRFATLPHAERTRLDLYAEGGMRDVFNFGLQANHLFEGVVAAKGAPAARYRHFEELPNMLDRSGSYTPWNNRWSELPNDLLMLYGDEAASPQAMVDGDGDHVGTFTQVLHRFGTVFNWAVSRWPSLPKPVAPRGGSTPTERQLLRTFNSSALNAPWEYAVALPPGYHAEENAEVRYPVVYLLHGYGMEPGTFMATAIIADAHTTDAATRFRPTIFVFPSGKCCFEGPGGQRQCREKDDQGRSYESQVGWQRECHQGTFWINRAGYTPADGTRYGDAFFELIEHIDQSYRTLRSTEVEAR